MLKSENAPNRLYKLCQFLLDPPKRFTFKAKKQAAAKKSILDLESAEKRIQNGRLCGRVSR